VFTALSTGFAAKDYSIYDNDDAVVSYFDSGVHRFGMSFQGTYSGSAILGPATAPMTINSSLGQNLEFGQNLTSYVSLPGIALYPLFSNSMTLGTASLIWANVYTETLTVATEIAAGEVVLTSAAPTVISGQIGYGGTTAANTNCGTLAGSAGCVVINVRGDYSICSVLLIELPLSLSFCA
jgi:hypothetical protein